MTSQRRILLLIILGWAMLIGLLILATEHVNTKAFQELETRSAHQTSIRVYNTIKNHLNYLILHTKEIATSFDLQNTIRHNYNTMEQYFTTDYYTRNNLSGTVIYKPGLHFIYLQYFNLEKSYISYPPAQTESWFKETLPSILKTKKTIQTRKQNTNPVAFFAKIPGIQNISYIVISNIHSMLSEQKKRYKIVNFRELNASFIKAIRTATHLPVNIVLFKKFHNKNKMIAKQIRHHGVYLKEINKKTLRSYQAIKDANSNIIGVIITDIPRTIFMVTEKHTEFSQLIIIILSIIGIIIMSLLVTWFFKKQEILTLSFERFFPHSLLSLLKKKNILDIHLGDVTEKNISVLFLDIRQFTHISEGLTPQENFTFINTFLKHLAPTIKKNNGYIDKYIGDAIMAIFPDENSHSDDAIHAAFDLLNALDKANKNNDLNTKDPVKIGIGINTGKLMIGILGAGNSLSGTAIGDTVNTASRIEGLTKNYGVPILISESCMKKVKHREAYTITEVDKIKIRGRSTFSSIYSIENKQSTNGIQNHEFH